MQLPCFVCYSVYALVAPTEAHGKWTTRALREGEQNAPDPQP